MGLMDSMKKALDARGMLVEKGRVFLCHRIEWGAVVNA